MTHTLHLLNQIEDKLLEYGRQVARITADRAALLKACNRYLTQYDTVHDGVDVGETPRMIRAAVVQAQTPPSQGAPKCD